MPHTLLSGSSISWHSAQWRVTGGSAGARARGEYRGVVVSARARGEYGGVVEVAP
jgi:hypothetical protein